MGDDDSLGLASELARRMSDSWRDGRRSTVEELLEQASELRDRPQALLRLIYEEICLRQEAGESIDMDDFAKRFPDCRAEIAALLECHRVVTEGSREPAFPAIGDSLGDFCILDELGRGAKGRVYLADQPYLAGRSVVLKATSCAGQEHMNLARLQHPYIVPLFWVQELPERSLRLLCMPYLGGATLDHVLIRLRPIPIERRSGADVLTVVDEFEKVRPIRSPARGAARRFLERASYVDAICWIGVCLADALHYAHEQGLVHFDVRSSNVLLAADGRPLLLDFHLARHPIIPSEEAPQWVGGTPRYMSPEQREAWIAVQEGRPVVRTVDARTDVFSLGLLLQECLGLIDAEGKVHGDGAPTARLSLGLQDILDRSTAPSPAARYATASALAEDLKLHLNHRPLQGVRNRSMVERWRKWRRRRPQALGRFWSAAFIFIAVVSTGAAIWGQHLHRRRQAEESLAAGRARLEKGGYRGASQDLQRGLNLIQGQPFCRDLSERLAADLQTARRGVFRDELRRFVEEIQYLYGDDHASREYLEDVDRRCEQIWNHRAEILKAQEASPATEETPGRDLLDLAVVWTDVQIRLAPEAERNKAQAKAVEILRSVEAVEGSNAVLSHELHKLSTSTSQHPESPAPTDLGSPRTSWECYALGRSLMQSGNVAKADELFDESLRLSPGEFWPWFCKGVCASRQGQLQKAREAFTVAIALRPESAECFYNRAQAYAASGDLIKARDDYDRALILNPTLASAALNRGVLHLTQKHYQDAENDFRRAMTLGMNPSVAQYNLALLYLERKEVRRASEALGLALQHQPGFKRALELKSRIERKR